MITEDFRGGPLWKVDRRKGKSIVPKIEKEIQINLLQRILGRGKICSNEKPP